MLVKRIFLKCDNPDCIYWPNLGYFPDISSARQEGWVISHDRLKHYCPGCSSFYKSVGRMGAKKSSDLSVISLEST